MSQPSVEHPLVTALKILQPFDEIGQAVWELGRWYVGELQDGLYKKNTKAFISQQERFNYLKKSIAWLRERAKEPGRWRELPVDFRTFVESPKYLNKPHILWPEVIKYGAEINSGRWVECVLTGAIGVAKSTLALYTQAYQTYLLACMLNPHEVFDLDPSSEILIVIQSISAQVAKDVDYRRLRDMIMNGPFFADRFSFQKDRESDMRFPRNIYIKPVAGHDQAAIGQNVIGGILDEVNFMAIVEKSKQATDGGLFDQAKQNYNSIASRRESRFMQLGNLPGMLCLVSSRKYPGQFTDEKEEEARRPGAKIYVYDKRLWELRPDRFGFHKGERTQALIDLYGPDYPFWFHVFVGDATRKPRILTPNERVTEGERPLVHAVPIENKAAFENDILTALREKLGVSTQAMNPFMMNTDAIAHAFGKAKRLTSREDCDFKTSTIQVYPRRIVNPEMPRFVHIDLAMTRDNCGIAIGHVPKFVEVRRADTVEMLPFIHYDILLAVKPPKGGEIEFSDIRKLLYVLRDDVGLPIKWVTADNEMMSKDTLQLLAQQRFITGYSSMDTDTLGYDILRQALYDRRVAAPQHELAQQEVTRLEFNSKDNKVDHPPRGSKDVADGMAGVAKGLTMRLEVWHMHGVSSRNAKRAVTSPGTAPEVKTGVALLQEKRGEEHWRERKAEEARDPRKVPFFVGSGPAGVRERIR